MERPIYQDGKTARQYECELSVDAENLNIYVKDAEVGLVIWKLRKIASCYMHSGRLLVKYGEFPHQTIECSGETARHIYDLWSGTSPVKKAEGFLVTRKYTAVAILCSIFIAGALLLYFVFLPWVGEKAASLIPEDVEMQLGKSVSDQFISEGGSGKKADSLINAFAGRIDFGTTYSLNVHVLKSHEINAFAVPGGNIFVYTGIIEKMDSYEELVALLGHEASHVKKRHSLKSICRSAASGFFIAAMFGDISGISAGIISQADEFRQLQYSRELETEADLEGLKVMHENDIDGQGMVRLLQLLEKEAERMPRLMKYVSTHPETEERIAVVKGGLLQVHSQGSDDLKTLFEALKTEISRS
jgi:predicted Zn-dependent protease